MKVKISKTRHTKEDRFKDFYPHNKTVVPIVNKVMNTIGWQYTDGYIIGGGTTMKPDVAARFALWLLSGCKELGVDIKAIEE